MAHFEGSARLLLFANVVNYIARKNKWFLGNNRKKFSCAFCFSFGVINGVLHENGCIFHEHKFDTFLDTLHVDVRSSLLFRCYYYYCCCLSYYFSHTKCFVPKKSNDKNSNDRKSGLFTFFIRCQFLCT